MRIQCPCGKQWTVRDDSAGRRVHCPECDAPVTVGESSDDEAAGVTASAPGRAVPPRRPERHEPRDEDDRRARREPGLSTRGLLSGPTFLVLMGVGALAVAVVSAAVGVSLTLLLTGGGGGGPPPPPAPPAAGRVQVIAAFYGQNISWLDVTELVRQKVERRGAWSGVVQTADWGEPAPDFKGPRTLLVRYSVDGTTKYKAVYEGELMTLP